jgi:DNA repair/transcription protein MET18/MMS19
LIELVQSLGEYINDEDEKIRARAVSYLVAVISALPPKFLSRQQIEVLCQFLCDRIEDGGAIEGLSNLQSLDRFTTSMAQTVVRA